MAGGAARSRSVRAAGARLPAGLLGGLGGCCLRGVGPGCRPPTPRESAGKVSGAKNKNGKSSPLSERLVDESSTFLICLGGLFRLRVEVFSARKAVTS